MTEARAIQRAAATIVINEREADTVRQLVPGLEPSVIRNGVDLNAFAPQQPPTDAPAGLARWCTPHHPRGALSHSPTPPRSRALIADRMVAATPAGVWPPAATPASHSASSTTWWDSRPALM